jgi:penicillin amidase
MKRLTRVLAGIGIGLLVIVVILAAMGIWFVRRPWPQVKGTIAVKGLEAPVEVIRDQWGVPHIYAENELDLFFAQGYVHAQDRLWQMEFNRRVGSGTLSAALGEGTLDIDRFMRTLGLRHAATRDWTLVDDETRTILQAYADGINAYIASHRDRLPLEFVILGVDPDPWTPVDTLLWGKVMAYSLSTSYDSELLRASMIAELGPEVTQQLMPPYPGEGPFIVPPEVRSYAWLSGTSPRVAAGARLNNLDDLLAGLVKPNPSRGSNNWVVHGSRTSTGMPLLANDTHLSLDMPAIWYENGLHGGRFDVVGFSFPGVPMVIIGHNSRIAWGVTNLAADVQDLYVERLNSPDQPTQYEFQGEWRDLEIVQERIEVAGGEPVVLDVLMTHHGPIINDVVGSLQDAEPMALRWTALDSSTLFRAVVLLDLADNWEQFRQALSLWDVPSQNFVYADVEGNIGYQTPGKIPIRPPARAGSQSGTEVGPSAGPVPVPGWTGEYEWQGFIPFDELPSVLNPVTGFIATANNKVVPDDYPYYLAYDWSAPYRAQRITDLLAADDSVTPEDMRAIHAQTYSLPAELLRPYLSVVAPDDELEARALRLVDAWDLYYEADSAGAAMFQTWYWFLVENTLRDELGGDLMDEYLGNPDRHAPVMIELMEQADSPWFDDVDTPAVETRDDIVRRSLADAVAWLSERYGSDPDKWEWGELHTKTFVHQPLGQSGIGLLEDLFNSKTVPARGDEFTVDAAWFSYAEPFAMTGGASQRFIADLSDLDNSLTIHTTGQSGQLFHRHREDFIPLWQNVEYHPSPFSRGAVESYGDTVLTLTPSAADEQRGRRWPWTGMQFAFAPEQ